MNQDQPPGPVFAVRGTLQVQRGMSMGMREPVLLCRIEARQPDAAAVTAIIGFLKSVVEHPAAAAPRSTDPLLLLISQCGGTAVCLQRAAGLPVFERHRVQRLSVAQGHEYRLAVPYWRAAPGLRAAEAVIATVARLLPAWNTGDWQSVCRMEEAAIRSLQNGLAEQAPSAGNVLRFLQAAAELKLPWTTLAGSVIRFGHGARSRWLDSSLTDATSCIGANLAHDKRATAVVLREAGLPVPVHAMVGSVEAAVRAAAVLGYPVVVKPGNCEQGKGVSANLADAAAVRRAYELALSHSSSVLVEKHIEGRDYRLTVLHGKLLWAIERRPGGVTGDGQQTILQLVSELNLDPRRGHHRHSALKPLDFDDEALDLLAGQGYGADAVPAPRQFVPLRRVANVARGGTPVAVNERVHADNRRLAERAAAALRLDLAGIDLIIPDIAQSWMNGQGAICEVNAQPSLGATTAPHLYGDILKALLQGDGRIPVTVIVGARHGAAIAALLERWLRGEGVRTGLRNADGIWIAGERIASSRGRLHADGLVLLSDPQVEHAILVVDHLPMFTDGLPFDRYTDLILADAELPVSRGTSLRSAVTSLLLPACTGRVLYDPRDEDCARWAQLASSGQPLAVQEVSGDDPADLPQRFFRAWRPFQALA